MPDEIADRVINSLPTELRLLFIEIMSNADQELFFELEKTECPSTQQRIAVESILASAFSKSLLANSEPTERGLRIDQLIGEFLMRWPIEA